MGDLFPTIVTGGQTQTRKGSLYVGVFLVVTGLLLVGLSVEADAGLVPDDCAGVTIMVAQEGTPPPAGEPAPESEPVPADIKPVKKEKVDVEAAQKAIVESMPKGILKVGFTWYGAQKQFVTVKASLKIQGEESESRGLAEEVAGEGTKAAFAASSIIERVTVNIYRGSKKVAKSIQKKGKKLSFEWMGREPEEKEPEEKELGEKESTD